VPARTARSSEIPCGGATLIALVAALREERSALPEEKRGTRRCTRSAREGLLQRENGPFAGMKKQHLPMKKPFFPFDAPSFPISIRSASKCSFAGWFINF